MCVFQLRNSDKLCEAFGEEFYFTLMDSLINHFTNHDEIEEYFDPDKQLPVIKVESTDKEEALYFEFFIIDRKRFIYFLAYKS